MGKRIILLLAIGFVIPFIAFGQAEKTTLKGTVVTGKSTPVPYATVTLIKQDSTVVNGAITDDNGKFEIAPADIGTFMVRVSGITINTTTKIGVVISAADPKVDIGDIKVTSNATQLNEVKITDSKPFMEMGIDKKTFNVERNITAAGGSVSDVLQNIPSVSVDADGSVNLRGKSGVTILIDGKPATLLGGDEASALQSLPASSVEQIEVITNPSAKYDATGMTGIINIVTKKEKRFGFNGNVRIGVGTQDKYNGGLGLNLKNEKWNFFLNSNFRTNRRYNNYNTSRENNLNDGYTSSIEENVRIFNGYFNSIGAEYNIDTNNSVTFTQNLNKMRWGGNGVSNFSVYPDGSDLAYRQERYFIWGGFPYSSSSSLDYKRKLKNREGELTANTTYVRSWQSREQEYSTYLYNANDELSYGPVVQRAPGTGDNNSSNSQIDYSANHFTKKGKLEAGVKTQLFWLKSDNTPSVDSPGKNLVVDSILLNGYDYSQHIYAAYTSWGDQIGKFRYQAGLRLEHVEYEGTSSQVKGQVYTNTFTNLFPSAFLSYELPKDQSVYLSYTRRTDRPRFWQLLPYVDLSNAQDTNVGNPNLVPEFIHNVELSYNKLYDKGHSLLASMYYQYTQNLITNYSVLYADGTSYTQRRNLNAGVTYGLELTGQIQLINRVWDATISTNFFQNEILGSSVDPSLDNSGFGWFGKVNTNIRLPKDFSLQFNYNYQSPKVVAQGIRSEAMWLDVALRKNLWDGKANIVLNVSDIFNGRKYTTDFDFGTYTQSDYRDMETRIGNITFSYRFGGNDKQGVNGRRRGKKQSEQQSMPDTNKDRDLIRDDGDSGGQGM